MADPADNLPYRPCVGIFLLNRDGLVFTGRRIDTLVEAWQMPQGGIDPGESPEAAALRELAEEIGTSKAEILARLPERLSYDLPPELLGRVWGGRYRGQIMDWIAMRFLGEDRDIDIRTAHPEFAEWRWTAPEALPALIVDFKRDLYRRVVAGFAPLLQRMTTDRTNSS